MTREEAIRFGNCILMVADKETDSTTIEFTKLAIKALEHDGVLQEIRHEIENEYKNFYNRSDIWTERCCGLATALEIIDRYLDKTK